jgi:DNA-directed RNA polymerase specialized sigma subunit
LIGGMVMNYLVTELSKEEKLYLRKIVVSARNRYFERKKALIEKEIVKDIEEIIVNNDDGYEETISESVKFEELEELFENEKLYKLVKGLSLNEKMVLFCLYHENRTIRETAKALNVDKKTVLRRRDKALQTILKGLMGGISYV